MNMKYDSNGDGDADTLFEFSTITTSTQGTNKWQNPEILPLLTPNDIVAIITYKNNNSKTFTLYRTTENFIPLTKGVNTFYQIPLERIYGELDSDIRLWMIGKNDINTEFTARLVILANDYNERYIAIYKQKCGNFSIIPSYVNSLLNLFKTIGQRIQNYINTINEIKNNKITPNK